MRASDQKTRRGRGIRWHLFQVLLLSILPIGLFAAGLFYLHWRAQEHERERSQVQLVRLLAAAVDNALDSTVERRSILASLWGSSPVPDEDFYARAKDALRNNADWSELQPLRTDGGALGAGKLAASSLDVWRPVITDRRPLVSNVLPDPETGTQSVYVGVPVVREGKVTHVLIAKLDLKWYDRLLTRQGLPKGGVAGLFDQDFKFVARSAEGSERRGSSPSEALVGDMKQKREGIGRYTNLNGVPVYTAWTFSRHGWGVAIATPAAPIEDPFWKYLVVFACLWAGAVVLAILYAFSKARLITASLESLEGQARHLAAGHRIKDLPASRVTEIDRAVGALEDASVLLQSATVERVRSLHSEREARAAAETANRAKDEFLAMLGHELRNPLAAISNSVPVLTAAHRTREQLDFVAGVISRQTRHLTHLIDDLLNVGRAVAGKITLARAPLDLGACVRGVSTTLQATGRFVDRQLDLDLEPVWISGDTTRIEQIATNLLVNATTFTSAGGRIRVRVSAEGDAAVLEVSDDGRGIAGEHLPHVFDVFFQADSPETRATGGLGIGLTMVQRLARLHDAEVTAQSAGLGRGARFIVRFPRIPEPAPTGPSPVAESPLAPRAILVVEDNADARESLQIALELQGHRVVSAADGRAALALVRIHHPSVALLDIGLPGMDGYELARGLRALFGPQILLIALTGYGMETDARKAREAGFDQHLTKPVDVDKLAQVMEAAGRSPQAIGSD